jgi:hypothetical protein
MPNPLQQTADLTMPVGLPPAGDDPVVHYNALRTRLSVTVDANNVTSIWVADEDDFSGVFAMCKGFLRYLPAGASALDGTTLTAPMLLLKAWLWDYLALRNGVSAGITVPKLIGYGNVHPGTVTDAVHAELTSNPRYQALSVAERTQIETDFMAGNSQMLVSAATVIARGGVDGAGGHTGQRRLDLTFLDSVGTNLDPQFYFDLWGLIGGPQVRGHPLVQALARPVTPSQMPLEGGLRVRVSGTGYTTGTTIQIAGQPAADVVVNSAGTAVYATSPALPAGAADVTVTAPNQAAQLYPDAITFTGDLLATVRAAVLAYAVALTEIQEQADALATAGTLDLEARQRLRIATDSAGNVVDNTITTRCDATGSTLYEPAISEIWDRAHDDLLALTTGIMATIA